MTKPMLTLVLDALQARKGHWREISRQMEPAASDSYYSWLTKLAQGKIREPSVNKIQRLYDCLVEGAPASSSESSAYDGPERRNPGREIPQIMPAKQASNGHKEAA